VVQIAKDVLRTSRIISLFKINPKGRHLLKAIYIDGTGDTALFSRPGDAMWATSAAGKGEIGKHLALAPTGGKVAFLSELSSKQMPGALFHQGTIELWDLNKKERLPLRTHALDQPLSWFPADRPALWPVS
jgi:hypothetical protein